MTGRYTTLLAAVMLAGGALPAGACGWFGESLNDPQTEAVVVPGTDEVTIDLETPEGMARMSTAYRLGKGVPQSDILARRWAKLGARAGHVGAMNDYAQMLDTGLGGPTDAEEAANWFRRSAEAGFAPAQHSLATLLFTGRGAEADPAEAELWLRRSAEALHRVAVPDLASRLMAGELRAEFPNEGCFWALVAGELGVYDGAAQCRRAAPDLSESDLAALREKARAQVIQSEEPQS